MLLLLLLVLPGRVMVCVVRGLCCVRSLRGKAGGCEGDQTVKYGGE
jgi:hypothetical protein